MRTYNRKNLNIKRLLALGILDIRGIAEKNEELTANEYFSKVEEFIENAPEVNNVFNKASSFIKNDEAGTELENVKTILSEIGYTELESVLEAILVALKNSDFHLAEKLYSETAATFNLFYSKIKSTYSAKKFTGTQMDRDEALYSTVLLKEALEYMDYEEANRKLRILAVDDVAIVLNTLTSVLSPYYEVFALKNSTQIENFLTHTTPELFLLDIEMNEVNGFDLVPIIRQFEVHKNTPIIFLTGNASYDNLKGAISLGACDFITKPINKEILLEKIEKNIVRKKSY